MIEKFQHIINSEILFLKDQKFILAVSGGVDSMVLLHLCHLTDLDFIVAHCNYQLRGEDSDLDEKLVEETCQELGIDFHSITFNTQELASPEQSIQGLARELRYDWFDELKSEYNINFIMLAHHLNDQLETLLINLSRGTGIKGLRGMLPEQNGRVRPLLSITKDQIEAFAQSSKIKFRTDQSNFESKYKRNLIRNQITPLIEQLHPEFWNNFKGGINLLQAQELELDEIISQEQQKIEKTDNGFKITLETIRDWHERNILAPCLAQFDLSPNQSHELNQLTSLENGKQFKSSQLIFIKQGEYIIIESNKNETFEFSISSLGTFSERYWNIEVSESDHIKIDTNPHCLQFDASKIKFPLTFRSIKNGDSFKPLGLKGNKLIHDYLKDKGINQLERKRILVISDQNEIIGILNHQISDHFKIRPNSKISLKIKTLS